MKKKKIYLEKRIFILFFLLSFFLVSLLIIIEWQLAKYGIKQVEDQEINDINVKFSAQLHQMRNDKEILFDRIISDRNLQTAIESRYNERIDLLIDQLNIPEKTFISIFDQNQIKLWGEDWEFLDDQVNIIFSDNLTNYYISSYGNKIYFVCFKEISYGDNFLGYAVTIENLEWVKLSLLPVKNNYHFIPFPLDETSFSFDAQLESRFTNIKNILETKQTLYESEAILRLSSDKAYGFKIYSNKIDEPSVLFAIEYSRDIYNFGQQSVLLFVLILLAITIFLIIFLGNWFSKTILFPIKTISSRMTEISANPSKIEPLKRNYQGVLGEMLNTFNVMNRSLSKYSENLREYKLISDNLDSGFFWLNDDLKITLCNNSLFSILEIFSADRLIGKDLNDFLKLNDNHLSQLKKEGITLHEWEINTGKHRKYILIKIMPAHKNKKLKFVGNITDITIQIKERIARQALELELIKSNKLAEIGRRIEGIIHNINSPLNTVLGYAQLTIKNQPQNQDMMKILEAGKSISHIVKGILNKSKQDSSSMIRSISLNDLIEQELELCDHNLFFKHYVDLKKDLDKNIPEIVAVYGDISLCLANILNNAIEALEKSPEKKIWVRTFLKDEDLVIEIEDSGEGIRSKNLDIIFEPYFTTKTKPGSKGSGFGLGLAISKNIVTRYGGIIKVDSTHKHGTTFTISLPIKNNIKI